MCNQIFTFKKFTPEISKSAFIAAGARIIGNVKIKNNSSIWFNAVLRGDLALIEIGTGSNIQDGSVIHTDKDGPCIVEENVVVGHNVTLHACKIEKNSLIGMGSTILSNTKIGEGSLIAAGSLVKENTIIEPYSFYAGTPAVFIKKIGPAVQNKIKKGAKVYQNLIKYYDQ